MKIKPQLQAQGDQVEHVANLAGMRDCHHPFEGMEMPSAWL
jgi:hypothetical protein